MIEVENFKTYGWESAIIGMRNPMNSWDKSDSLFGRNLDIPYSQSNPVMLINETGYEMYIGDNDLALMKRLRAGGSDDRKYLRQIFVSCDITAPLYWWKEMDQYKVATVTNSCSTMHKIASKEFTMEDFSFEKLIDEYQYVDVLGYTDSPDISPYILGKLICEVLNIYRKKYLETKDKNYWWQMIQLLPSSYNQNRTWTANYEVLANIYHARKNHKLDEWHTFCDAIKKLPYAKDLIIGEK